MKTSVLLTTCLVTALSCPSYTQAEDPIAPNSEVSSDTESPCLELKTLRDKAVHDLIEMNTTYKEKCPDNPLNSLYIYSYFVKGWSRTACEEYLKSLKNMDHVRNQIYIAYIACLDRSALGQK